MVRVPFANWIEYAGRGATADWADNWKRYTMTAEPVRFTIYYDAMVEGSATLRAHATASLRP